MPTGANRIAESSGTGGGSKESCADATPSERASSRADSPRVKTCTAAPWAMATWAARCAEPPNPQIPRVPPGGTSARRSAR